MKKKGEHAFKPVEKTYQGKSQTSDDIGGIILKNRKKVQSVYSHENSSGTTNQMTKYRRRGSGTSSTNGNHLGIYLWEIPTKNRSVVLRAPDVDTPKN